MRNKILHIISSLAIFVMIFLLTSCEKAPINGQLDGMWEVKTITPLPSGWNQEFRKFYNFSLHVCQLTYYDGSFTNGNMNYQDDILTLDFPNALSPESVATLKQYGIDTNPIIFKVKFQGKRGMTLSNENVTITLLKF